MRCFILVFFIFITAQISIAQSKHSIDESANKGKLYIYWGWNNDWFTKSDISFSGSDYDFTLRDVVANDNQSSLTLDNYFNINKITIPQYNFRIGYFINAHWDISIGIDHMKYVVNQNQTTQIDGNINLENFTKYNGTYDNNDILLSPDFLRFEHTDGLNYANLEARHSSFLLGTDNLNLSWVKGLGLGLVIPRTNTTLLTKERYDQFHLSGYGFGAMTGLNLTLLNSFFIQSEIKAGYINLPSVRTTNSIADSASHDFFFSQINIIFGWKFKTPQKKYKRAHASS